MQGDCVADCRRCVRRGVNAAPGFFDELLPLITEELLGDEETRHFVPQVGVPLFTSMCVRQSRKKGTLALTQSAVRSKRRGGSVKGADIFDPPVCACQFVEEACKRQKAFIPMCAPTISELVKDDGPAVLSKVMRATGVLFRKALLAICSEDGEVAEEDQADMWEAVREAAVTLRQHATHEHPHVRNSAVMFLQVLANVLSVRDDTELLDDDDEESGDDTFSLHSIPPCHQFLDYSEMKKFGQDCVQQLLDLLQPANATPWQTMTVVINCLGRVARHNPQLIGTIEPVLTNTCTSNFAKSLGLLKWEAASIRSTVKSTLLALLKLPRCAAYAAVLIERLSSLGAVSQAEAARRIMEKARSQYARGAGSKRGASKRQADPRLAQGGDVSKRARVVEAPLIPLDRLPKGTPPEEWQPELVSELILAAMKNYPPALPPHLIDVADTPLSMWPERLANPGAHAKTSAMDAADKADEIEAAESSQTATAIRNKALMNAKPLQKAVIKALADDALLRLLEGESAGWACKDE